MERALQSSQRLPEYKDLIIYLIGESLQTDVCFDFHLDYHFSNMKTQNYPKIDSSILESSKLLLRIHSPILTILILEVSD